MAEDTTNNGADTGAPSAGTQTTENMVPQSRFNEVNNALKDMRAELDALKTANQTAETTRLEEQQEWQTLAETRKAEIDRLKGVEEQFTSVNATLDALLEAQLAELSDDAKAMVPKQLSKQDQINWIAENRQRLTRPAAPDMHAGARGDSVPPETAITAEERPAFIASGMSQKDWNKKKQAATTQEQPTDDFIGRLRAQNLDQET